MTTAREQAREAAWSADDDWQDSDKMKSIILVHADAASDVWEPLLRDLLVAYENAIEHGGPSSHVGPIPWGAYGRAKEALG